MGSKAWRNLGAIFLACAGLVGCNNGPETVGGRGPLTSQPRATTNNAAWTNPSTPPPATTVGQGRLPTNTINPAPGASQAFPPPGSPGPGLNSADPSMQRFNSNMAIPSQPNVPITPASGPSQFGAGPPPPASFPNPSMPPSVPPMPSPPPNYSNPVFNR